MLVRLNHCTRWCYGAGMSSKPPSSDPIIRKTMPLPKSLWDAIADYRFGNRLNAEAEAMRQIVEIGVAAVAAKASAPKPPPAPPARPAPLAPEATRKPPSVEPLPSRKPRR
jgi:hypothetical protein